MSAKVYLHPKDMHRTIADAHSGCIKHFAIPASDMNKVIDKAAKAIIKAGHIDTGPWSQLPELMKEHYRIKARAAYRAGGFVL